MTEKDILVAESSGMKERRQITKKLKINNL
jgi:hypothetical protein